MQKELYQFLETRGIRAGPWLLGCSGGADSKALLHLLTPICRKKGVVLLVAHVDHGWRKESAEEAVALEKQVEAMGWPFILKTVDSQLFGSGNWELKGREIRLQFFSELYLKQGASALFLGHHADDRAEGVLKRLFEGASLPLLGGVSSDCEIVGMRVLRPLLSYPKKKIVGYLEKNKISYFSDPTNTDPAFLRGRMRSEMLPFLQNSFGKQIGKNLCLFADEAQAVITYFSSLNRPFLETGEAGVLDLQGKLPLPEIQLRYLLKEWLRRENVSLSRSMILSATKILIRQGTGTLCSKSGGIIIKNGVISIIN